MITGDRLRRCRIHAGETQTSVAEKMGVLQPTVCRLEKRKRLTPKQAALFHSWWDVESVRLIKELEAKIAYLKAL